MVGDCIEGQEWQKEGQKEAKHLFSILWNDILNLPSVESQ